MLIFFRFPLKILIIAIITTGILSLAKIVSFLKEKIKPRFNPQVKPQISPILALQSINIILPNTIEVEEANSPPIQNNQNFNNQFYNPEIVSTNNSLIFMITGMPVVSFLTFLLFFESPLGMSNVSGFSSSFMFVEIEILPYYLANFVNPLILYSQNKRLRKFVKELYYDLIIF